MRHNSQHLKGFFFILVCFIVLGNTTGFAQGTADYTVEISTKFGRGLLNVLSSPLEIPCTIRDEVSERGAVGSVTGLFKGIAFFARRVLVGVTEVGTFVIPMERTIPPVCAKGPEAKVE
ncbi:MAG: exosortase system-associated protein, TIGR04073 family [Candidatus Omnitrophica bacterium]|nr:exosortase system-associated protein, TIGR04073 family [Candidatus Omnitrophota bacterium]